MSIVSLMAKQKDSEGTNQNEPEHESDAAAERKAASEGKVLDIGMDTKVLEADPLCSKKNVERCFDVCFGGRCKKECRKVPVRVCNKV